MNQPMTLCSTTNSRNIMMSQHNIAMDTHSGLPLKKWRASSHHVIPTNSSYESSYCSTQNRPYY